ncbi:hypothetical protein VIGAN_09006400 [Vigna angularis var. angularis]|uniref:Uncharacterized protein n=1 Tax=Vigna angularis var. angularis TaxID=157739 RepID=A0A0S3SVF9_PHAAN|nr:hypothetical protein VIGAN_09006400 [Vigna angularis var. angularis]
MASSRAHLRLTLISIHRNWSHVLKVEPNLAPTKSFFLKQVLNRPRICVMGIAMNLVTYLVRDLNLPSPDFATIVTNVMGTVNLLGLVGGFLSDAKLGRYLTVAISTTIAAMGVSLLSAATTIPSMRPPTCSGVRKQHHECIQATGKQLALLYIALNTIPVGGGGIKSNVSGLGVLDDCNGVVKSNWSIQVAEPFPYQGSILGSGEEPEFVNSSVLSTKH